MLRAKEMMDLLFALARMGFLTKHKGGVKLRNKLRIGSSIVFLIRVFKQTQNVYLFLFLFLRPNPSCFWLIPVATVCIACG